MRATGRRPRMFRIPLTGGALAIGILATIVIATLSVAGARPAWTGSTAYCLGRRGATWIKQCHLCLGAGTEPPEGARISCQSVRPTVVNYRLHHRMYPQRPAI